MTGITECLVVIFTLLQQVLHWRLDNKKNVLHKCNQKIEIPLNLNHFKMKLKCNQQQTGLGEDKTQIISKTKKTL